MKNWRSPDQNVMLQVSEKQHQEQSPKAEKRSSLRTLVLEVDSPELRARLHSKDKDTCQQKKKRQTMPMKRRTRMANTAEKVPMTKK